MPLTFYLLGVLVFLQIIDGITTYALLKNGGQELNKAAAWVFEKIGLVPGLFVLKTIVAAVFVLPCALGYEESNIVTCLISLVYVGVVVNNIMQMRKAGLL